MEFVRKYWRQILVIGAISLVILLTVLAVVYRDSLQRHVIRQLASPPILEVVNESGEPIENFIGACDGGSLTCKTLLDGESARKQIYIDGESTLTISWRDHDGNRYHWWVDIYLINDGNHVQVMILEDMEVEVTDMYGDLRVLDPDDPYGSDDKD